MKIIDTLWFTTPLIDTLWFTTPHAHTIGIVMGKDGITNKPKAYIGLVDGVDEEADIKLIAESGTIFPKEIVQRLSKHYEP